MLDKEDEGGYGFDGTFVVVQAVGYHPDGVL